LEIGWKCQNNSGGITNCSSICGDGLDVGKESCDDHNVAPLDGCFQCSVESGWNCTDVLDLTSQCSTICGDGIRIGAEMCGKRRTMFYH
jgi:cysteine-rich repeat protein